MPKPWNEQVVLITGATSGIGYEAAIAIARLRTEGVGPRVVIVGRSPAKTARCLAQIRAASGSDRVESLLCDFESMASIRALAAAFLQKYERLDLLLNNAGTVYSERKVTVDGYEATFAVNHLGYFLLTGLLLDRVKASAPARIVSVASAGHLRGTMDLVDLHLEHGYTTTAAYCRSKLGNVLFTRELARRLVGTGVTATCLHPGAVATGIWDHAPRWVQPILWLPRKLFFLSQEQGGGRLVHAATDPSVEGLTGVYFDKCKPVRPGASALDDALAARLWVESGRLVGLDGAA